LWPKEKCYSEKVNFVVGGYLCKLVELRISKGLQAVALATGIGQESFQRDKSYPIHPSNNFATSH
jgi:hypothetical protein